jgi:hypothetical protein
MDRDFALSQETFGSRKDDVDELCINAIRMLRSMRFSSLKARAQFPFDLTAAQATRHTVGPPVSDPVKALLSF